MIRVQVQRLYNRVNDPPLPHGASGQWGSGLRAMCASRTLFGFFWPRLVAPCYMGWATDYERMNGMYVRWLTWSGDQTKTPLRLGRLQGIWAVVDVHRKQSM